MNFRPARCSPFFLLILAACAAPGRAAPAAWPESLVWSHNEGGVAEHFVYGLTATPKGTVLAFTEARLATGDDTPHHLVLKRSRDGGLTWSEDITIERADGRTWEKLGIPGRLECWANPAAITDRRTGRTFIFYVLSEGRIAEKRNTQRYTRNFYRYSDDEGATWSERIEITSRLNTRADGSPNLDATGRQVVDDNGFPCDDLGRAFHMPGPGHGLQLQDGRLIMQFWSRTALEGKDLKPVPQDQRKYGLRLLFSDDGGKIWTTGPRIGTELPAIESRLVELDSGEIYLNARSSNSPDAQRAVLIGTDRGATWRSAGLDAAMPRYVSVDSGLITARHGQNQVLLLSHPRATHQRKELTISASLDGGASWSVHQLVHPDGANYSDLVNLSAGQIGLIYGKGASVRDHMDVYFIRFSLADLGLK